MKCDKAVIWINTERRSKVFVSLIFVVLLCGFAVQRSINYLSVQNNPFQHSRLTNQPLNYNTEMIYQSSNLNDSNKIGKVSLYNAEQTSKPKFENTEGTTQISTEITRKTKMSLGTAKNTPLHSQHITETTNSMLSSREKDAKFEEMASKQKNRIRNFRQTCIRLGCDKKTYTGKFNLFFSNNHKLAWKMVPKIGSTFLIQAFGVLNDEETKSVFYKPRSHIHIGGENIPYKRVFDLETLHKYTVLTMARNPFSRLFSAYIDKVYLPNALALPQRIYLRNKAKSGKGHCQFNTTFDEFLRYALDDKIKRLELGHYGPLVTNLTCNEICQIPNIEIVKQESFSDDIDYALKLVGVEKKKYNTIYTAMHEKNVQSTIPGIVKTAYEKMRREYTNVNFRKMVSENCLTWTDIAKRLWKSFQIQGYIHDTVDFPHRKFESEGQYQHANYLIHVMLEETKEHPLTHEQKVAQRTRAMLNAYAGVSQKTISKIEESYSFDFSLYNYSHDLLQV